MAKKKHNSFYFDVDGEYVHMQADPNMTPETEEALKNMVRAVRARMDSDEGDGLNICEVCHDRYTQAPSTKCGPCRMQELIDGN